MEKVDFSMNQGIASRIYYTLYYNQTTYSVYITVQLVLIKSCPVGHNVLQFML